MNAEALQVDARTRLDEVLTRVEAELLRLHGEASAVRSFVQSTVDEEALRRLHSDVLAALASDGEGDSAAHALIASASLAEETLAGLGLPEQKTAAELD